MIYAHHNPLSQNQKNYLYSIEPFSFDSRALLFSRSLSQNDPLVEIEFNRLGIVTAAEIVDLPFSFFLAQQSYSETFFHL